MSTGMLHLGGARSTGQPVRTQNVNAACAIANMVKSSLGPIGLDKMLVDNIGDVTCTNDGATILKLLEIEHPAAKVLVELAELQDNEVGDGTTSVECQSGFSGAPFSIWFLKFTLGKRIMGGTEFPIAFILQIIVILVPHSPEFMLPTCFLPFGAIFLAGVYTLVMPVSSIL
ncbi:t-complex protein 1 subunit alpha [Trichonephila clavata]|uniref:T-complex protein 1 subunit alpha n=1 Tax=Trichonephila clavata TaxID=2740835 RepID=A0A8X6H1A5_TRICU|nr:t-complex protein 1 subunit alpha [Trichonephila clavata]